MNDPLFDKLFNIIVLEISGLITALFLFAGWLIRNWAKNLKNEVGQLFKKVDDVMEKLSGYAKTAELHELQKEHTLLKEDFISLKSKVSNCKNCN